MSPGELGSDVVVVTPLKCECCKCNEMLTTEIMGSDYSSPRVEVILGE
jgi:hypothetical protein